MMAPSIDRKDCLTIPGPRSYPIIGNARDIDSKTPAWSMMELAQQYGPICTIRLFGQRRVMINSVDLFQEVCNEKRFGKANAAVLASLRDVAGSGLFTARTGEHECEIGHRILMPTFSPLSLHGMFDQMKDVLSQCILKWARMGPDYTIDVAEDYTRLTLDTLALTAMGYRFNSYYTEEMHPFVHAFMHVLDAAPARAFRPAIASAFSRSADAKYNENVKYMRDLAGVLVRERRTQAGAQKDLLSAMIDGKDAKSGEQMTEESIVDNMITFLVASHETTSGLLSFATYYLVKNPEAYARAHQEIDEVLGKESLRTEHLGKLPHLNAVLRETLRLSPSAPLFFLRTNDQEGAVVGGHYFIESTDMIGANLHSINRDPKYYGADANAFKPKRMLEAEMSKRPAAAWKPFGNGSRACIGRHFAWQEGLMALAMTLQNFDLEMKDPQYVLAAKQGLTQKPVNFEMRARLRVGISALTLEKSLAGSVPGDKSKIPTAIGQQKEKPAQAKPMTILYGSNCGTCEAFARMVAADAAAHGFEAQQVATLDSAKGALPTDQPILIVTASYEGEPCDNAAHFYRWIENMPEDQKLNVSFAVFGAGHSDWAATFHKVPKAIDNMLAAHGGKRICSMGTANAAKGDVLSDFQTWEDETFWPALAGSSDKQQDAQVTTAANGLTVEVTNRRTGALRMDVLEAKVTAIKTLTAPGVPEKRHLEIQLPTELTYTAGDYLAVLPFNPHDTVRRVMSRFALSWDAMLKISANSSTTLPVDYPIAAYNLFSAYVELSQPATKRDLKMLQEACQDDETKDCLQQLNENSVEEVTKKRVSLLDLLERFATIDLPLSAFLPALVPMRVRQYSISSSALAKESSATLTYAVLDQVALSGHGRYQGTASTFLSNLKPGDSMHVAIKPSHIKHSTCQSLRKRHQ